MARRDLYHETVINALRDDGWTITDNPLYLSYGGRNLEIDLGAELPIGAEKGTRRIAVEVKSFIGKSEVVDLEDALGQYLLYRTLLSRLAPDRELFLAVSILAYDGIFSEPLGQLMVETYTLRLLVFDDITRKVLQWIP